MLETAIYLAVKAFYGKKDKGGNPYIEHLTTVANKVKGISTDAACVAYMHDILEDCGREYSRDTLEGYFPAHIVNAIVLLTKTNEVRYDDYIANICTNRLAALVKRADLEHNLDLSRLSNITEKDFTRVVKYHAAYTKINNYLNLE